MKSVKSFADQDQLLSEFKLTELLCGEIQESSISFLGITSNDAWISCSGKEKQQSGQAETRGRAQAGNLLITPEAGLF